MGGPDPDSIPEARLSELLRAVDWRFLLGQSGRPRALVLDAPADVAEAVSLVADPAGSDGADVVVLGFPTRASARRARAALRPGGAVVCIWRRPRPAGPWRAGARLRRAGFGRVDRYWKGPHPERLPEFWMPLGSRAAAALAFGQRPPRSPAEAALRRFWRAAAGAGLLTPVCAIGKLPPDPAAGGGDLVTPDASILLITAGERSTCTAVGIPFTADGRTDAVIKYSRLAGSDAALAGEGEVLDRLEAELPRLGGVPRPLGTGEVAGRLASAQTAIHGQPLNSGMTTARLAELAPPVTERLIELAATGQPADAGWRERLVGAQLSAFERRFGAELEPAELEGLRRELSGLAELPLVWEHRDCGVWNMVCEASGGIGIHDWEFAEPRGLPGRDLAFFLATATFDADGVLADGTAGPEPILASHARMLDPATPTGAISASCMSAYGSALGISQRDLERLRLLSWVGQALDTAERSSGSEGSVPDSLRASTLSRFIKAEIRHLRVKH